MLERVLGPLERRWAWVGTALRVQKRYDEIHGGYLGSAVTLSAFLALFPLLLAIVGVVGMVSSSSASDIPGTVIAKLGIHDPTTGKLLRDAFSTAEASGKAASLLGLAGLLWSGLGLVAAFQMVFDSVWQAPGRGLKDKLYGLAWLVGAGVLFWSSLGFNLVLRHLPGPAWPFAILANLAVFIPLWLWTFHVLTNRDVGWRALLPGAVVGAVGLQLLQTIGGVWVPRMVSSSSALYGSIGVVFAILAWLLFFGRLVVYAVTLNVVRWEEAHGTVSAEIEVPRMPGRVPLGTTRAGEVLARS
ncbi:MAG TPA: YhjD/YihY/BrkB family envelope integrity protein [Acidimicrobiales bacterium]|nr:YhjD/YihY/BrkB family envelope integrity protein [Acidimicrobiales bacterium]